MPHILVMAALPLQCRHRSSGPGPLVLLRRRCVAPIMLWRCRSLPEPSGRYGAAAASRKHPAARACPLCCASAMSALLYSLRQARRCPAQASCRCSGVSASRGGDGDGGAYTVAYKDDWLSTAIYREGALPLSPSFLCMNQPGNSVSFGTPLTLKSSYNTTASYKTSSNRTLATAALVLLT